MFVSEKAFLRLLIPDDSRREQMYVERALARHGPHGLNLASIERDDRNLSQLEGTSFLPERLEWLLLSRERDSVDYRLEVEASGRLSNIAQLWPNSLQRLWLSHFIIEFKDLDFIADRLPGLETLMVRLPPTKYAVSTRYIVLNRSIKWLNAHRMRDIGSKDREIPRKAAEHAGISSSNRARDTDDVERHGIQLGRHALHHSCCGTSTRADRILQQDFQGQADKDARSRGDRGEAPRLVSP